MNLNISPTLRKKNPDFAIQHPKVMEGLALSQLSRGAHLEKLSHRHGEAALYSIRLSIKSRLLLTRLDNGDWLLLDELTEHEYDKSPFMKRGNLKCYLDNQPFAHEESKASASEEVSPLRPVELEFFNHQFIELSHEQSESLYQPLPLVVQGMPGSGKSCVALSMIRQCINTPQHHILYVTSSSELVDSMHKTWLKTPGVEEARVAFKSYVDLFPQGVYASRDDFSLWFKKNRKLKEAKLSHSLDAHRDLESMVYQEFRMMSGYSLSEYQRVSERQRLFEADKYPLMYSEMAAYLEFLRKEGKVDVSLVPLADTQTYTHVFVDEAQDFSTLQLLSLKERSADLNIAYFINSNQSLQDHFSKLPSLRQFFGKRIHLAELPYSFRCSKAVTKLANDALKLKHHVTGGTLDKEASTSIHTSKDACEGSVVWLDKLSQEMIDGLNHSVKTAIICDEQDRAEIRRLIPGALVMTVSEAKGLEYESIIAYHLLERYVDKRLNDAAKEYTPGSMKENRPKAGAAHHEYGPALNLLFTAFTRAQMTVFVLHKQQTHDIRHVLGALKNEQTQAPVAKPVIHRSSLEEINAEIKRQILVGNRVVAWELYSAHIENNREHFQALCDTIFPRMSVQEKQTSSPKVNAVREKKKSPAPVKQESKEVRHQGTTSKASTNPNDKILASFMTELQNLIHATDPSRDFLMKSVHFAGESLTMAEALKKYPLLQKYLAEFLNDKGLLEWSKYEPPKKLLSYLLHVHPHLAGLIKPEALYGYTVGILKSSGKPEPQLSAMEHLT